jgi:hypothetical protein
MDGGMLLMINAGAFISRPFGTHELMLKFWMRKRLGI